MSEENKDKKKDQGVEKSKEEKTLKDESAREQFKREYPKSDWRTIHRVKHGEFDDNGNVKKFVFEPGEPYTLEKNKKLTKGFEDRGLIEKVG